jgi:hypothetical protein
LIRLARPKRFELLTPRFVVWRSSADLGELVRYAICQQSRACPIETRRRFAELRNRIEDNGVRAVEAEVTRISRNFIC